MDRLFSAFPSRLAGMGLLVLRLSLAASLVWNLTAVPSGFAAVLGTASTLLALGVATPCVSGAVATVVVIAAATGMSIWPNELGFLLAGAAAALMLIGPGAYSIDARVFGWRHVVLSSRTLRDDR